MGWDDIDNTQPAASGLVSAGDDEIRQLKTDVLEGAAVEHSILAATQGRHMFSLNASPPSPLGLDGRIAFETGNADNPLLYVEGSGVSRGVGIHRKRIIAAGSVSVANNSGAEVNLATYSDGHQLYLFSVYPDQNVDVNYAQGIAGVSPAGLYVWLRRTRTGASTGNDKLAIRNEDTGVTISVSYDVFQLIY